MINKPYNRNSICIKCGSRDADSKYYNESDKIRRCCCVCGYIWEEDSLNIRFDKGLNQDLYILYETPTNMATLHFLEGQENPFQLTIDMDGLKSSVNLSYQHVRQCAEEMILFCEIHDRREKSRDSDEGYKPPDMQRIMGGICKTS